MTTQVTLTALNENDSPESFHGEMLSDDGQGNQLWRFSRTEDGETYDPCFANRYYDPRRMEVTWTADREDADGWDLLDDNDDVTVDLVPEN